MQRLNRNYNAISVVRNLRSISVRITDGSVRFETLRYLLAMYKLLKKLPVREGPGVKIHFPVSAKSDSKCAAQSKQQRQAPYPEWSTHPKLTQTFDSTDEIFSTTYAYELQDL